MGWGIVSSGGGLSKCDVAAGGVRLGRGRGAMDRLFSERSFKGFTRFGRVRAWGIRGRVGGCEANFSGKDEVQGWEGALRRVSRHKCLMKSALRRWVFPLQRCKCALQACNGPLQDLKTPLQDRNTPSQVRNSPFQACKSALQACKMALQACKMALQACKLVLRQCKLALQRWKRAVQPCRGALRRCFCALQPCGLALQPYGWPSRGGAGRWRYGFGRLMTGALPVAGRVKGRPALEWGGLRRDAGAGGR